MTLSVHVDDIPYRENGCALFEHIRDLPHAAFLDSCDRHAGTGRFDILTAQPWHIQSFPAGPDTTEARGREFFTQLHAFHQAHYSDIESPGADIPFCGGLLGYLGYDLGERLHGIPAKMEAGALPAAQLCAYDWCVLQDHLHRRAMLVSLSRTGSAQRRDLLARLRQPDRRADNGFRLSSPFTSSLDAAGYRAAFNRIQDYILAGDCYQVNLTQCFSAGYRGDPWHAYRKLRSVAGAPFAAYLALAEGAALLCLSPERFMSLRGGRVETAPIKGTRRRHDDSRLDERARHELQHAPKDRAENLMIVDLLRNDLGHSCIPGSIRVERLFEVQSFAAVHHLVSTISGELRADRSAWQLLRDSFPGGSITGAPKRRAMQVIDELEPHARRVYCGSVLYVSADGRMDSNIAIRSLLCEQGRIHCWSGGGIVADSDCESEMAESHDKVGKLLDALEQTIGH